MELLGLVALGNFTSRLLKQLQRSLFSPRQLVLRCLKTYSVIGVEKEGFTLNHEA